MVGQLGGEELVRVVVFCRDDEPARVAVDAMHDAGAQRAADAGETVAAVVEQGVDQGAVRMARRGMDDEPARLVDDDDVVVLVDNVQRDVLRNGVDGRGLFGGEFDLLVSRELVALVRRFAVHEDTPVLDGFRRGGAGQVFNCAGEAGVEPRTGIGFTCLQQDRFHRPCSPSFSRRSCCKRRGSKSARRPCRTRRTHPPR